MRTWTVLVIFLNFGCAHRDLEASTTPGRVYAKKWGEARHNCKGDNNGVDWVEADPGKAFQCKNGLTGVIKKIARKDEGRK